MPLVSTRVNKLNGLLVVLGLPLVVGLAYGIISLQHWIQGFMQTHPATWFILVLGCVLYFLCMAIPFLPGVELGFALMMIFGWPGIIAVYLTTQLALNLSYWLGNRLTEGFSERFSKGLQSTKTPRWISFIICRIERFPGLVFVGLLNLPGNAVIGGAGGISAFYGLLRILSPWRFTLTVLLATLPLPVFLGAGLFLRPVLN